MDLDKALLQRALEALGDVLEARGLSYELAAIGGSALLLLDMGVRPTKDLDVVAVVEEGGYVQANELPAPLRQAVSDVGATFGLSANWLNTQPSSLLEFGLPEGFQERAKSVRYGSLTLQIAGRRDQIFFKLYAAADQGPASKHAQDLRKLAPRENELLDAARWAITHDPSTGFRSALLKALEYFGVEDAAARN